MRKYIVKKLKKIPVQRATAHITLNSVALKTPMTRYISRNIHDYFQSYSVQNINFHFEDINLKF